MPNLLLIADFHPGSLGLYYERAFGSLGWSVRRYDYGAAYSVPHPLPNVRPLRRALRPVLWRRMNREAAGLADGGWDLILAIKAAFLDAATVDRLRAACESTVMIYPDSPWDDWTQRRDVLAVLSRYARVYIWCHRLVERLNAAGVRAGYLAFGYDPEYDAGCGAGPGERSSIAFAAQPYDNRIAWLRALEGLSVRVYGAMWRQAWFGRASSVRVVPHTPMGGETARIYAAAAIGLNIVHPKNSGGHNMRTFEIPATGALMITNYCSDLDSYFPSGTACLSASSPREFRAHCEWALGHPGEAARIAAAGRASGAGHTYARRAREIADDLNLPMA